MDKIKNVILIIFIAALIGLAVFVYNKFSIKETDSSRHSEQIFMNDTTFNSGEFSDGLNKPESIITYELQEFEPGVAEKQIYAIDINNDEKKDRITKTFFENWNSHSYYKYTVELKTDNGYIDITPKNLQTVNGADCDLQQVQFKFKPYFQIIVISRDMGKTWDEPTMANKRIFSLDKNILNESKEIKLRNVCDVKELLI